MYKLAIFDFDGTLVDSAPGIVEVMRDVVNEYSFSAETLHLWSQLIGIPLQRQVEILFPDEPLDFIIEVTERYRTIYDTKGIAICPPFPGLTEMLDTLQQANILVTIASSKRRHLIDNVLEHYRLADYFSLVVGAQEVQNHKPHPESVLLTLQRTKISLAETVVIGDSSFDLDMARNARVDAIGVTTGIHTKEILAKSEPAHIVNSLKDVLPIILNGNGQKPPSVT